MFQEETTVWLLVADPRNRDSPSVNKVELETGELSAASGLVREAELTTVAQEVVLGISSRLVAALWPSCVDADALVLAPHGLLHHLPVAAGPTPEGIPLLECLPVSTLPSTSFVTRYLQDEEIKDSDSGTPTLLRGPDLEGNDAVSQFCKALSAYSTRVSGPPIARPIKCPSSLKKRNPFIVAAHGKPAVSDDQHARIFLEGRGGKAFWLGADRFASMMGDAPFAFLAVCRSSTSEVRTDDEPLGLVWHMLTARCRAVVGSLWNAEPRAAAALTFRFFKELYNGCDAGTALGNAVSRQRQDPLFADFRDWGGFTLYGDWRWRLSRR
jgi:hypothetical protein